jgi:hypothetical protein
VARYYRADLGKNLPASTEITGYAASAFAFLHSRTGDGRYLECAIAAAKFLIGAWDSGVAAMPFELEPSAFTYFFDCGIIARGLLAVWRTTHDYAYLHAARLVGDSMLADFPVRDGGVAPILSLPSKEPIAMDAARWSRSPGCYQLKSAMAWLELADATFEERYRDAYDAMLERALVDAPGYLPGHADRHAVMDRLHPYLYFLEGLMPRASEPACAEALRCGIPRVAGYVAGIGPEFLRADVLAQLLRVRLYAHAAGAVTLDVEAAAGEAELLAQFQASSADARIDGGFYFGRRGGEFTPHVSPVPVTFAVQALDAWKRRESLTGLLPVI